MKLLDVRDIEAYQLGDRAWYVATARRQFVGTAMVVTSSVQTAACTWETRILAPLRSADNHLPIIIKAHLPQAADGDDVEWPPLPNYQEVAQRIIEAAQAEGRNPTWVEVLMGALSDGSGTAWPAPPASRYARWSAGDAPACDIGW
ncbi:hypothetical protein [Streptomyces gardneri]|uniref:hypothetical protein n=1 Tax=Streptomyces gardneri TaxID=66892 RepID=UPI00340E7376